MMQKKEVYCDVCGKSMGMRHPKGVYAHLACADKRAQGIRDKIQARKDKMAAVQTVDCPEYLEPKHRCGMKK